MNQYVQFDSSKWWFICNRWRYWPESFSKWNKSQTTCNISHIVFRMPMMFALLLWHFIDNFLHVWSDFPHTYRTICDINRWYANGLLVWPILIFDSKLLLFPVAILLSIKGDVKLVFLCGIEDVFIFSKEKQNYHIFLS